MSRLLGLLLTVFVCAAALGREPSVRVITFATDINAASGRRLAAAVDDAEAAGDTLLLVELDTPGGSVEATEDLVKRMLASKVPIAVWVGPSGARAASGGFYLLIAADVAAMAPGTRTGAASAVFGLGPNDEKDVLLKKVTNDLAALARSIAEHRGRDVASCERAVVSAEAFTDGAARKAGLIDLVANDRADLLRQLDGRTVRRLDGTQATLSLRGAKLIDVASTRSQRIEERIGGFFSDPTIVFLLLVIGLGGLYVEFNHPGAILPGVAGGIALILFAFGARALSVSIVGLLLIVVGLALFVLEVKIVSHGLLTLGGIVSVVAGSVLLFPGKDGDLRPPLALVLPGSLALAALCVAATRLAIRARALPVTSGREGLKGEIGVVDTALTPAGTVFVHGELWQATAPSGPVAAGTRVKIVAVRDLVVDVEPVDVGR